MVRYPFIVRLLHPLLHAGFDRRFQCPLANRFATSAANADVA
jgi:hypothetical protein